MPAYYNEIDPGAAAWLRALIGEGLIAPGDVDERSIEDVRSDDLAGYDQVHWFSGVGIWSHALRRAGWPDDKPVWTGSCPCQPFSLAGKGQGFDDSRHLWPAWFRLIAECRPDTVFGEQVASAGQWVDLVRADLEGLGAAFASLDLPAAGFAQGAHIRQRFYWVADLHDAERWSDLAGGHFGDWPQAGRIEGYGEPGAGVPAGGMANNNGSERSTRNAVSGGNGESDARGAEPSRSGASGGLGDASDSGSDALAGDDGEMRRLQEAQRQPEHRAAVPGGPSGVGGLGHSPGAQWVEESLSWGASARRLSERPDFGGTLSGCDWLLCRDARIRPVSAGSFPLAPSSPGRVGLLRGYGNGLDAKTAVNFISAYMESCIEQSVWDLI